MLHKISDFCKKIDSIKAQADKLYNLKYNHPKTPERDAEVNHLIEDIQSMCKVVGNDNKPYDIQGFRGLTKRLYYDTINE